MGGRGRFPASPRYTTASIKEGLTGLIVTSPYVGQLLRERLVGKNVHATIQKGDTVEVLLATPLVSDQL